MATYPKDNPIWLYEIYQYIAISSPTEKDLRLFQRELQKPELITPYKTQLLSHFYFPEIAEPFVNAIIDEWESVRSVLPDAMPLCSRLGDDLVNYKSASRHAYKEDLEARVATALTHAWRDMALLERLRIEGEIAKPEYDRAMQVVLFDMDIAGLNGMERMLHARPDLHKRLTLNQGRIIIPNQYGFMQEITRQDYYRRIMEGDTALPSDSPEMEEALGRLFGEGYTKAHEAREAFIEQKVRIGEAVLGGRTDLLLLTNDEVTERYKAAPEAEKPFWKYLYIINNELSLLDTRLPTLERTLGASYAAQYAERQKGSSLQSGELLMLPSVESTEQTDTQKKTPADGSTPSEPLSGTSSPIEDTKTSQRSQPQGTNTQSDSDKSGGPSDPTDSSKKLAMAGKLGAGAVCGAVLLDGARKITAKETSFRHKCLQTAKIAAGVAGAAVILFKPDLLSKSATSARNFLGK